MDREKQMKWCSKCRHNCLNQSFAKKSEAADGLQSYCKACNNADRTHRRALLFQEDAWQYLMDNKEIKARAEGIVFSLTDSWLSFQPKFCPYLGLDFVLEPPGTTERLHQLAPTFDRIVPGDGYTPENTRLISWWANRAKGDMPDKEFRVCCLLVEERLGGRYP